MQIQEKRKNIGYRDITDLYIYIYIYIYISANDSTKQKMTEKLRKIQANIRRKDCVV